MLRRAFALLILVILVDFWIPTQRTVAQTECPEGGCKVFLPVVSTYVYATAVVTGYLSDRYCPVAEIYLEVTNVSTTPITDVQIRGTVSGVGDYGQSERFSFALTTYDVLFPGEKINTLPLADAWILIL